MNKYLLTLCIGICIVVVSCKDKGKDPVPQKEQSLLLGYWTVTESYWDTNTNGTYEVEEKEETGPDDMIAWEFRDSGKFILYSIYRGVDSILLKDTSVSKWAQSTDGKQVLLLGKVWDTDSTTRDTTYIDIISLSKDKMILESFYSYINRGGSWIRVKTRDYLDKR